MASTTLSWSNPTDHSPSPTRGQLEHSSAAYPGTGNWVASLLLFLHFLTIQYNQLTFFLSFFIPSCPCQRQTTENKIDIDYRNILNCQLNHQDQLTHTLTLSFINSSQDQKFKLKTLTLTGNIEDSSDTSQKEAQNWVENLLLRSYEFKGSLTLTTKSSPKKRNTVLMLVCSSQQLFPGLAAFSSSLTHKADLKKVSRSGPLSSSPS
jgi:hypothetical protein